MAYANVVVIMGRSQNFEEVLTSIVAERHKMG